jgi:hypothetical protein
VAVHQLGEGRLVAVLQCGDESGFLTGGPLVISATAYPVNLPP